MLKGATSSGIGDPSRHVIIRLEVSHVQIRCPLALCPAVASYERNVRSARLSTEQSSFFEEFVASFDHMELPEAGVNLTGIGAADF